LRLLHLELAERQKHPFTLFNLGMTYADIGRYEEAVVYLEKSIGAAGPRESHLRKAYALLAQSLARLGRSEDALDACRRGLEACPGDPELEFRRGMVLHELGQLRQAETAYLAALSGSSQRYLASVDRGVSGYKARHNLALVYGDLGDWSAAEGQWRQVVAELPDYAPGWRGLGESLARQGRLDEAAELTGRLVNQTG
jgi:tetratricopeptide (TPR) repeat protein